MGFLGGSVVKNLPVCAGDTVDPGLIPGLGRALGGNGNPLQYSCLENSMDKEPGEIQSVRGVWWVTVHGIAESDATK